LVEKTYSNGTDIGGASAISPRPLIKAIFYSYSQSIRSSRLIEKKCREDLVFRYLVAGVCPDHSTINLFRKKHLVDLEKLFSQIVILCGSMNMADFSDIAIDGSIFKADCGYWSKDNMEELEKTEINAYIPDRRKSFEERGTRDGTLNKYHRNYFRYDEKNDEFVCPEGKKLKLKISNRDKHDKNKIISQRYFCEDCMGCKANMKRRCTKAKRKQICVDWQLEGYKKTMREKLLPERASKNIWNGCMMLNRCLEILSIIKKWRTFSAEANQW